MRISIYTCVVVVYMFVVSCGGRKFTADSPLHAAFVRFEDIAKDGCHIDLLPDTIDWCNGKLNHQHDKLPANTICQSISSDNVFLLCKNGRWISSKPGRDRRSITSAYTTETNTTCSRFCTVDDYVFSGKSAPYFDVCPSSITIYPSNNERGNETYVHYSWDVPEPMDQDGKVISLQQIVGPENNASLEASSSPGINHVISYVATDNDHMTWTCSFTVTAEIPTCPPIIHITNGNSSCTDFNRRYSECSVTCNHGYQLNGTRSTVCEENGTWSYGEDVPQCIIVTCTEPIVTNKTNIEIICDDMGDDNDTDIVPQYGSLCWMRCPNDFLLKNNELETTILQELSDIVIEITLENSEAMQAASDARDAVDTAEQVAADLEDNVIAAENNTDVLEDSLLSATNELNNLTTWYNNITNELAEKQKEYDNAGSNGVSNSEDILSDLNELNKTLGQIRVSITSVTAYVEQITSQLTAAQTDLNDARTAAYEALLKSEAAAALSDEKEALAAEAAENLVLATANFHNHSMYSNTGTSVVSSYVVCTANGEWQTSGEPYCLDMDPPDIICLPVVTHIISSEHSSGVVTWAVPEVYDNSGNVTVYRNSGPSSGSNLTLGQHTVVYQATDETGNLSPVCTMMINVQAYTCNDVTSSIDDENIEAMCDGFQLGATCKLTCSNRYTLEGTASVMCKRNSTTYEMYWTFTEIPYCIVEVCAEPTPPTDGAIDCVADSTEYDNSTDNSTVTTITGLECVYTCNDGYMLPYKTDSVYTCDEDGVWTPEELPTNCIDTGEEEQTEYTFQLTYNVSDCQPENKADIFAEQWADILTTTMTSYRACTSGYMCELGDMVPECSSINNEVTVQFKIFTTCEGAASSLPWEASCDLQKDGKSSLATSITNSVEVDGVLDSLNVSLVADWLETKQTEVPTCPSGSFLIGSFCARCAAGSFYAEALDRCLQCGKGAYTNTNGRTGCTTCFTGSGTVGKGATECVEFCQPGSYSSTGLEPCATCNSGTYQPNENEITCITCPANTWTTAEGSDSADECVDYDMYFDADVADLLLTSVGMEASVVFWMKYYYATHVTIGLYYADDTPAFGLEISDKLEFVDGWNNEPLDVTIEMGAWTMFCLTWETTASDEISVQIFKDGEEIFQITLTLIDVAMNLKISVGNTTLLSGLSVSNVTVDAAGVAMIHDDCSAILPGAEYTMDDLAATRLYSIKYAASTCKVSTESVDAEHCGINQCEHSGVCIPNNNTAGYTCNCSQQYGGPFCEELLVSGNWSDWFQAAGCSATCGPGTQLFYRLCNNPSRSQYGNDCEGNSTDIIECFLENCTVCDLPEVEDVASCELNGDHCVAGCPPGYVMPRGQDKQTYQCGQTTNYTWTPHNRLPMCSASRQPQSYVATLTFTFDNPVPCDIVSNVINTLEQIASSQICLAENSACNVTVEITECAGVGQRRKRMAETHLNLIFSIPLTSSVTFDLVQYYTTSIMTESILEAVTSISLLEQTIEDILTNTGQYTATVNGIIYTIIESSAVVMSTTNCDTGQVPVEAVCAQCQKGTHLQDGWCVYCDRGSYQDNAGQTTCVACPSGQQTDFVGARDSNECIVIPGVPIEPPPVDIIMIIIVIVVVILVLAIVVVCTLLAMRFYRGAKDREKYDMEADRTSLYTDFPDIAYNVYFKRRQVLGFDENGFPLIGNTRFNLQNGTLRNRHIKPGAIKPDTEDIESDYNDAGEAPAVSFKEPLYQDEQVLPFTYNPYEMWSEDALVSPYDYPQEDTFDFPKLAHAVRYRVPGRQHLQNTYPLSQFGYMDKAHIRSRKNLPLPVNIPIPKQLPQLMYRKPEKLSLQELLESKYGFKKRPDKDLEEGIVLDPKPRSEKKTVLPVPRLFLKKKSGNASSPSPRSASSGKRRGISPRSAKVVRASASMDDQLVNRSPRAVSAFSPMSVSFGTPSPRSPGRPATTLGRPPRSVAIDESASHPKPSRYIVPKDGPLPKHLPFPSKSALRMTSTDEPRPETSGGRKSVTIREDVNLTRPSTTSTSVRPSTVGFSSQLKFLQPTTDAKSARDTIVSPYSARPRSSATTYSDLPRHLSSDTVDIYRPPSSYRPITPAEHPKPILHSGVTIARGSGLFFPPVNISFNQQPPTEQRMRQMQPPPFLNRVTPNMKSRRVNHGDDTSASGSFFLTELPTELSASRHARLSMSRASTVSLEGSVLSKTSTLFKKPSPPPDYSSAARDILIETSSMTSHLIE